MRSIPALVVELSGGRFPDLQAKNVQDVFSIPEHEITEQNTDYVAMIYLNTDGKLYWLPRFINYLRNSAAKDSYHFDVMLNRLSDPKFAGELRGKMTTAESMSIFCYLDWIERQGLADTPHDVEQLNIARKLWG